MWLLKQIPLIEWYACICTYKCERLSFSVSRLIGLRDRIWHAEYFLWRALGNIFIIEKKEAVVRKRKSEAKYHWLMPSDNLFDAEGALEIEWPLNVSKDGPGLYTPVWSQDWDHPLEKRMATHSSILAWRMPWTGKPGGLSSIGSQRVVYNWTTNTRTHTHTHTHTHTYINQLLNGSFQSKFTTLDGMLFAPEMVPEGALHPIYAGANSRSWENKTLWKRRLDGTSQHPS